MLHKLLAVEAKGREFLSPELLYGTPLHYSTLTLANFVKDISSDPVLWKQRASRLCLLHLLTVAFATVNIQLVQTYNKMAATGISISS